MNGYSPDDEKRLIDLLAAQKKTMERILALTEEQSQMLEADDADGFNLSLDRRQAAIEEFDRLHQESAALMQSYASAFAGAGANADAGPGANAGVGSGAEAEAFTDTGVNSNADAGTDAFADAVGLHAVEKLIHEIAEITEKCKAQNDKNALAAHSKAEDYSTRIGSLGVKRKSLGAYIHNVSNDAELFDKKM